MKKVMGKMNHNQRLKWITDKIVQRVERGTKVKIYHDDEGSSFRAIELSFLSQNGFGASYISFDSSTANSVLFQIERIYLTLMDVERAEAEAKAEAEDIMSRLLSEMFDKQPA